MPVALQKEELETAVQTLKAQVSSEQAEKENLERQLKSETASSTQAESISLLRLRYAVVLSMLRNQLNSAESLATATDDPNTSLEKAKSSLLELSTGETMFATREEKLLFQTLMPPEDCPVQLRSELKVRPSVSNAVGMKS